jgi:hypothetical protein
LWVAGSARKEIDMITAPDGVQYATVEEFARMIKVSPVTVRRNFIKAGLPVLRARNLILVHVCMGLRWVWTTLDKKHRLPYGMAKEVPA